MIENLCSELSEFLNVTFIVLIKSKVLANLLTNSDVCFEKKSKIKYNFNKGNYEEFDPLKFLPYCSSALVIISRTKKNQ